MWNSPLAHPWQASGSSAGRRTSGKLRVALPPGLQAPRDGWERGDGGGDEKHAHAMGGVEAWRRGGVKANKGDEGARYNRRGVCEVRV